MHSMYAHVKMSSITRAMNSLVLLSRIRSPKNPPPGRTSTTAFIRNSRAAEYRIAIELSGEGAPNLPMYSGDETNLTSGC